MRTPKVGDRYDSANGYAIIREVTPHVVRWKTTNKASGKVTHHTEPFESFRAHAADIVKRKIVRFTPFPRRSRDQLVGAIPKVTRPACAVAEGGFNLKQAARLEYVVRICKSGWVGDAIFLRKGHPVMERLA